VTSTGCHWLLREGASYVTNTTELLELVDPIGEPLAPPTGAAAGYNRRV
jgi:predicted Rossmann fold nucleotide-binding protein DprA/Smf involved in DNA uptake